MMYYKNRFSFILLMTLVLIGSSSPWGNAASPWTIVEDQQQPDMDLTVGGLAIGGASEQMLAQTVTVGVSGRLTEVQMPIACSSGKLIVEIRELAGNIPGDVVLMKRTFKADLLPSTFPPVFQPILLGKSLSFQAGERFAIVLQNKGGSCGIFQGPIGDPYPAGEVFFDARPNPPGWVANSQFNNRDLPFKTRMLVQ